MLYQGKVKLTKRFTFDMAHALYNHGGQCKNIHGHTYHLEVTVEGFPRQKPNTSDDGMVMDFGEMKQIVKTSVLDSLDHTLVLNQHAPYANDHSFLSQFEKVILLPFQPTCENLVLYMVNILIGQFGQDVKLYSLRLDETPTSYAVWTNES